MYIPLRSTVAFAALVCVYYVLGNCGHARSQGGCGKTRHQTKKMMWKDGYTITVPTKGHLPAPHSFRCSHGRTSKSRLWPIRHWGREAESNPEVLPTYQRSFELWRYNIMFSLPSLNGNITYAMHATRETSDSYWNIYFCAHFFSSCRLPCLLFPNSVKMNFPGVLPSVKFQSFVAALLRVFIQSLQVCRILELFAS